MACLLHTDDDGPEEYYITPFDPCPPIVMAKEATTHPCPCPGGCEGTLREEGRNVMDTLTFMSCDVCGHACVAEDKDRT